MDPGLIYDVGVHIGEDTGYYLHKGFRVVGIEANPVMCETLRQKFADAIADGRFTLVNVGVAQEPGELDFYVCDDVSEWSSFNLSLAGRDGARHHAVKVQAQPFDRIVAEHGTPWYCKIDIEGNDRLCLEGFEGTDDGPQYVSVEMNHDDADIDLDLMRSLGYTRFKLVSQTTRSQPLRLAADINGLLPVRLSKPFRGVDREIRGARKDGTWTFPRGSSGPLSEDIRGPWRDADHVLRLWDYLHRVEKRRWSGGGSDWYDIHATTA